MIYRVPRDRWRDELDSFNRQHEGWLVSVATRSPDGQIRVEASGLPLQGVTQSSSDLVQLAVEVGDRANQLAHPVRDITAISIDLTDDHAERALIIASADRTTTTVTFRSPMRPEHVDGLPFDRRTS